MKPNSAAAAELFADDSHLLVALRRQDAAAYEYLVRDQIGRLLQVARRFVGEEEARDAVQEAFLAAFKAVDRFDGKSRISTWLHRIVVNACLMRLRKKSHQMEQSLEPLLPRFLEDGHRAEPGKAWRDDPEENFHRSEVQRLVREAIDQLPTNYRSVVLLRDIEGLSGHESAEMLGISTGAVKVRLHRARLALRELLDPYMRSKAA